MKQERMGEFAKLHEFDRRLKAIANTPVPLKEKFRRVEALIEEYRGSKNTR